MTIYPTQPTGDNSVDLINIFASNAVSKIAMSTSEILEGYNNDGEAVTPLTSTPDGNKFNFFWYQVHNTLAWVVNYSKALFDNKLETSGGTLTGNLALGSNKATSSYVPVSNSDLTNKLYVDTAVSGSMWLSEVRYLSYPNLPTLPSGMEVVNADGRALSKTTYSSLYSLIGTTYGGTEAGLTYNIPDLRGKYTVGWNGSGSLDSGRIFGSDQKRENNKFQKIYDYSNGIDISSGIFTPSYNGVLIGYVYGTTSTSKIDIYSGTSINLNNRISVIGSSDSSHTLPSVTLELSKGNNYYINKTGAFSVLKYYPEITGSNNSSDTQTNISLYPVIRIK